MATFSTSTTLTSMENLRHW